MIKKFGTRQEVFNGEAYLTKGGLKAEDLVMSNRNTIVSKKKQEQGKTLSQKYRPQYIPEEHKPKELKKKEIQKDWDFVNSDDSYDSDKYEYFYE